MSSDEELKNLLKQAAKLNETINRLAGESKTVTFGEFARGYLEAKLLSPSLRASTKRSFGHHTRAHLIPAFDTLPIEKVSNAEWLKWVALQTKVTRFFNARKCLVEILLAAKEQGLIERTPKLENPDQPKPVGRALSGMEIFRLLRHTRDPFFRFFFFVLAKTGFRPREILKWKFSMFKFDEPGKTWLCVPGDITKTGRSRDVPVCGPISKRIYAMWKAGPASPYVFPHRTDPNKPQMSYHGAFRAAIRNSGVQCVPYDFRRSFVTRCAAEGQPLLYVAKYIDSSVMMLEKLYAKTNEKVLRDIAK